MSGQTSGLRRIPPLLARAWHLRKFLTPFKLANICLVKLQWLLRTEYVIGRPYAITIEPTNFCNSNCRLCPTNQRGLSREKGVLQWEPYRDWIDRYSPWIYEVSLAFWGEPLLAPNICRMITYAHDKRIRTFLSTNLHALRPERGDASALVASGLDKLTCSLHAASQGTYEVYQPGKEFEAAVNKIRAITDVRQRSGSKTPEVLLNFVVTRFNEHEIPAFTGLAHELGCEPQFTPASLNLRFIPSENRDGEIENRLRNWLPRDPAYVLEPYRRMLDGAEVNSPKARHACKELWVHLYISWDGMVYPCWAPGGHDQAFGDLAVQSLGEIWNGPRYRAARRRATDRNGDDVICAHCCGTAL